MLSFLCRRQGALNVDLFALHFRDKVGVEPLSLVQSSGEEEVRAFLSDHQFLKHTLNQWTLLCKRVLEYACKLSSVCDRTRSGRAMSEQIFCYNTICNLFVHVFINLYGMQVDSAVSQQMKFNLLSCNCNVSRHTRSLVSAESALLRHHLMKKMDESHSLTTY